MLRATPVTSETETMPPRPAACASLAAHNRRARSSRCGKSDLKRARIALISIIQQS